MMKLHGHSNIARPLASLIFLAALVSWTTGCPPLYESPELHSDWPDDFEGVALAKGEMSPAPIEEGDTLTWEYGNQGGAHLWVGFRAVGDEFSALDDDEIEQVWHRYELFAPDGDDEPITTTEREGFLVSLGGGLQTQGIRLIQPFDMHSGDFADEPHRLVLTVTLPDETTYESERWIELD